MCLIIFNWSPNSQTPLIVAANRDEFHQRPSLDAHFWNDEPSIFAGRDLEKNGTWLGLSKVEKHLTYKFAALTNFRCIDNKQYQHSRGEITHNFLRSEQSGLEYAQQIKFEQYAGFNGLFFDGQELVYCHFQQDQKPEITILTAGTYGLSNAKLDSPWPKVKRAKTAFTKLDDDKKNEEIADILLAQLNDNSLAEDNELPETGVGIELERMLSPVFIISPAYGTRTSSVVIIKNQKQRSDGSFAYFRERQFSPEGKNIRELSKHLI